MQAVSGVAERFVAGQTLAGTETVERDGEGLDAGEGQADAPFLLVELGRIGRSPYSNARCLPLVDKPQT
jgi:hypothetical protein